jgi:steroid 5-alpha reductase family enzyme
MLMALIFNAVNSLINGAYLSADAVRSPDVAMVDLQTICGVLIFLLGFAINVLSDNTLLKLRAGKNGEYQIPRGGMFERVSCANFLGEIIEWIGFAVLCWNLPALAFAIWTIANLIPRAIAHHRWYLKRFEDYPSDRKAIIPYVL